MNWNAKELSVQPVAGKAWYVLNSGGQMLHCGIGTEGKELAKQVADQLNLVATSRVIKDQQFRQELESLLSDFCSGALALDPEVFPVPQGHQLHQVSVAIKNLRETGVAIQMLLMRGPDPASG